MLLRFGIEPASVKQEVLKNVSHRSCGHCGPERTDSLRQRFSCTVLLIDCDMGEKEMIPRNFMKLHLAGDPHHCWRTRCSSFHFSCRPVVLKVLRSARRSSPCCHSAFDSNDPGDKFLKHLQFAP